LLTLGFMMVDLGVSSMHDLVKGAHQGCYIKEGT
jgi:hypothetical protein